VIIVWNYLVIYNRRAGEIVRHGRFEIASDALGARFEAEHEFCDEPDVEVVVLGAESWDALYRTHSRYFKGVQELAGAALERESSSC
jgi:hypothetical protein